MRQLFVEGNLSLGIAFVATSTLRYSSIVGGFGGASAYNSKAIPIPCVCTLEAIGMTIDTALDATASITYTIYKNSTAQAMTLTIPGGGTGAVDTANIVTFTTGDVVAFYGTAVGAVPTTILIDYKHLWNTVDSRSALILGGHAGHAHANFAKPQHGLAWGGGSSAGNQVCPITGTLKNLYIVSSALLSTDAATSVVLTLGVNSTLSTLAVSLSSSSTANVNTVNAIAVVPGDILYMNVVTSGGTAIAGNVGWSMELISDTDGEYPWMAGIANNPSTATNNYNAVIGAPAAFNAVAEATAKGTVLFSTATVKSLYVYSRTQAGAGGSWDFTFRVNTTSSVLTIALSGAVTSGGSVGTVPLALNDVINVLLDPTSNPVTEDFYWGALAFIPVAAPAANVFGIMSPRSGYWGDV